MRYMQLLFDRGSFFFIYFFKVNCSSYSRISKNNLFFICLFIHVKDNSNDGNNNNNKK